MLPQREHIFSCKSTTQEPRKEVEIILGNSIPLHSISGFNYALLQRKMNNLLFRHSLYSKGGGGAKYPLKGCFYTI